MKRPPGALVVFVGATALFAVLHSRQYTEVDGALRCLDVLRRQRLFFHGNNHLLYPANVLAWSRLAGLLGIRATTPEAFLRLTALMNSCAAAGCVALVFALVRRFTGSVVAALGAAVGLAFARAFLLHATASAEPMVGLWWSLLGVAVPAYGGEAPAVWRFVLAGALLALSVATYQSMIFAAPVLVVLCVVPSAPGAPRVRTVARNLLAVGLTAVVALAAIFGAAALAQGERGAGALALRFSQVGLDRAFFGGFSWSKAHGLPLGITGNIFAALPPELASLRAHIRGLLGGRWLPWTALFGLGGALLGAALALGAWRMRGAATPAHRRVMLATAAGAAAGVLGPAYWAPGYDKLWLQPIAFLVLTVGLAYGAAASRLGRGARLAVLALLGVEVATNVVTAVEDAAHPSPYLASAAQVARLVGPEGVVLHDWNPVSSLYDAMWARENQAFDAALAAIELRDSASRAVADVVQRARARGATPYVLAGPGARAPDRQRVLRGDTLADPLAAWLDSGVVVARFPDRFVPVTLRRL